MGIIKTGFQRNAKSIKDMLPVTAVSKYLFNNPNFIYILD